MLSIVPLLAGGVLLETGAGGSAPKHVEQVGVLHETGAEGSAPKHVEQVGVNLKTGGEGSALNM